MKIFRRFLPFTFSILLALSLVACGNSDIDLALPDETENGNILVTDMTFLDGMWSSDGLDLLYFDSANGYYIHHSIYGPTGRGEFTNERKPMINFADFLYDFYLREDGVLLPNQNGMGSDLPNIDHYTFRRDDEAKIYIWDLDNYDGMWQNAAGETIIIDAARGEYEAKSSSYASSGTVRDEGEGRGLYLFEYDGYAYICPSPDGNSFTISSGFPGRYSTDGHFDGVFYRNGDIEAYTDLSQAEFYDTIDLRNYDGWVWYFDGVNTYYLGDGYEIRDDGFAYYKEDGKIYPAGWIPEQSDDLTDDWEEDWMEEAWDNDSGA